MNEGFFGDVQQADRSPDLADMMFDLDEELENLPSERTFTSSDMQVDSYFPMEDLSRPCNPMAYLLENQQEDVLPDRGMGIHMRHFVSVAPSDAKLRDGTYHQFHNDTAGTLRDASDDFTTLCQVDGRKRKIEKLEAFDSSTVIPVRRVKPRATRSLYQAFAGNMVVKTGSAQPLTSHVECSDHIKQSKKEEDAAGSSVGSFSYLKIDTTVRKASFHDRVYRRASASIDIPTKNSRSSRDRSGLEGYDNLKSSSLSNSRAPISSSSWRAPASCFEYFCRSSHDISSPLRLRFQNLLVRSFGRTGSFDAA